MNVRRFRFIVFVVGILASMTFLVVAAIRSDGGLYYVTLAEYRADPPADDRPLRLAGNVLPGSIERSSTGVEVSFVMFEGTESMPVSYSGTVPDTFVDGAQVVVSGRVAEGGAFEAHELLAKCPSKYEEAEEGAPGGYGTNPEVPAAMPDAASAELGS